MSIGITSYNRKDELLRCLKSIDVTRAELIEVIVSEDNSPQRIEIEKVVEAYKAESAYAVTFNTNPVNLGYDNNLAKIISLASGEYVLLMSDDDMFSPRALDRILCELQNSETAMAYTAFVNGKALNRRYAGDMQIPPGEQSAGKYIYDSILFSGLIFKRNWACDVSAERFKNLNYFQVYLFLKGMYQFGAAYFQTPLVVCVGDGENAYGKVDSGRGNELLADRDSVFSNLEFHRGLIRVVKLFDSDHGTHIEEKFGREYALRTYGGMSKAARLGRNCLREYWKRLQALQIRLSVYPYIYYALLYAFGPALCDGIFSVPQKALLALRSRCTYREGRSAQD